ncbi:MAG: TetR/AcrR family transcriptional regulator [Balneolaceae bacterium]
MDSKKKQILDSASHLFSTQGYERTSISQIVNNAKVSKGLVYHHFKNKEELLREIIKGSNDVMLSINTEIDKTLSPEEKLVELINKIFHQLENEKDFFRFNLTIMFQPSLRSVIHDLLEQRSMFLYNSVFSIFQNKGVEDPELDSYMFIAEIDGIVLDYLSVFDDLPLQKIKNYLINKYG